MFDKSKIENSWDMPNDYRYEKTDKEIVNEHAAYFRDLSEKENEYINKLLNENEGSDMNKSKIIEFLLKILIQIIGTEIVSDWISKKVQELGVSTETDIDDNIYFIVLMLAYKFDVLKTKPNNPEFLENVDENVKKLMGFEEGAK